MKGHIDRGGYIESVGRRKTASARVRVAKTAKKIPMVVNGRTVDEYFPVTSLTQKATSPLTHNEIYGDLSVTVVVQGGGCSAQAEAIRHGLTGALVKYNEADRKVFKSLGFLTRDSRRKERKKPGLRKARRAPQWRKR